MGEGVWGGPYMWTSLSNTVLFFFFWGGGGGNVRVFYIAKDSHIFPAKISVYL